MQTRDVEVRQTIRVTVDEAKFTPEFMFEFRRRFYQFYSVEEHLEHLAQLYARGICDNFTKFIEGYGPPKDFDIKFEHIDGSEEVLASA